MAADDDFGKQLADAFAADATAHGEPVQPETPPAAPETPEATPPAPNAEEPKKDDPANPTDPNKKDEEPQTPPANPENKPEEGATPPENPETPGAEEPPAAAEPLTRQDITQIIRDMRNEDRISSTAVADTTQDVINAYYPEGLSNVLIDQNSGKELRTPQDVVDASNGEMSMEQAAQWLMNEQFKLDKNLEGIRDNARAIAETDITFRTNSVAALQKYEPLFKAYPQLQAKVFDKMMKQVRVDQNKKFVISAPDPMEFYDDYLEPYQMAFEHSTQQPATNPVTPQGGETPPPATPGADDRLDETPDGGTSEVDDPNDFAQQVKKELSNPF